MKISFAQLVKDITIVVSGLDGDSLAKLYNTLCGTNLTYNPEKDSWTDEQREES
jgi:hypothetical protein